MNKLSDLETDHQRFIVDVPNDDTVTGIREFIVDDSVGGILGIRWKKRNGNENENVLFNKGMIRINEETILNTYPS
eukprot:3724305-Ditylum_brightwellii.AAC.1